MSDTAASSKRPGGFRAFLAIWSSQIVSVLTSGMTSFALTIWMYQQTKSATAMALVQVFYILPFLLMSFVAGPMIDRYSRRLMMALSDIAAAIGTVGILIAFFGGFMQFWMVYASAILLGLGNSFQWPAFSATIALIVPKKQLGRANGMMSLIEAGPSVFAPILAGALMPFIGIVGILALDVATFIIAVGTLWLIDIPQPARSLEGEKAKGNLFKEAAWGFKYIFERPSLLGLQLVFLLGNFFFGIGGALVAPMILAKSGSDSLVFGGVQSVAAIGGVAGGLLMSAWGGFKRKPLGIAIGTAVCGIAGGLALGIGQGFWAWSIALAVTFFVGPLMNGSNQAIWQAKVAPDLQGRVFSARRLIAWVTTPLTPIIAGPLADFCLEPAMKNPASPLFQALGPIFGTGPGAGMGIIMAVSGLLSLILAVAAMSVPAIRDVEQLLPDHDQAAPPGEADHATVADGSSPESGEAQAEA